MMGMQHPGWIIVAARILKADAFTIGTLMNVKTVKSIFVTRETGNFGFHDNSARRLIELDRPVYVGR